MKIKLKNLYGEEREKEIDGFWLGVGHCMMGGGDYLIAETLEELQERFSGGFGFDKDKEIVWYDDSPYNIRIMFYNVSEETFNKYRYLHGEDIDYEIKDKIFGRYVI